MIKAKIYQPAKTAMQSGRAKTKRWKLEFSPTQSGFIDPLMGWNGQRDTQQQLNLFFDSRDDAVDYAKEHQIDFTLVEPKKKVMRPKSYADNFKFNAVRKRR